MVTLVKLHGSTGDDMNKKQKLARKKHAKKKGKKISLRNQ